MLTRSTVIGLFSSFLSFIAIKLLRDVLGEVSFSKYALISSIIAWLLPFTLLRYDLAFSTRKNRIPLKRLLTILIPIHLLFAGLYWLFKETDYLYAQIILFFFSFWILFNSFFLRKNQYDTVAIFRLISVFLINFTVLILFYYLGTDVGFAFTVGAFIFILVCFYYLLSKINLNEFKVIFFTSKNQKDTRLFVRFNSITTFFYLASSHLPIIIVFNYYDASMSSDLHILLRVFAFPVVAMSSAIYNRNLNFKSYSKLKNKKLFNSLIYFIPLIYLTIISLMYLIGVSFFSLKHISIEVITLWGVFFYLKFIYNSWIPVFYEKYYKFESIFAISLTSLVCFPFIIIDDFSYALAISAILASMQLIGGIFIIKRILYNE